MNIKIENIPMLCFKEEPCIEENDIYISGKTIVSVGKEPKNFFADKVIKGKNRLAIPGLINTHTHSYMSLFRNIADDLSFPDWLFGRIDPLEAKLTHDDMYWGAMLGCLEMIKTGTTCFVDMNMDMEAVMRAVGESGIRAVLSRGLVGEGDNEGGKRRLSENLSAFRKNKNDRITFMLGPHAPYSCDTEYLKTVIAAAKENGLGITMHLCESENEVKTVIKGHKMTPIALMDSIGLFDVPTLAAHCVYLCDEDMDIMKKRGVSVAANPKSNLKLANGIAPIDKLYKKGVNITVGTDSAASNNTLNMFSELNYTALLHKGTTKDPTVISAKDTITFATKNAARAIGSAVTGEIKEGNAADISILNTDLPQFHPSNDLIAALCYSANGSEVDTVIVGGEILMENGDIQTIDTEKVYYECEKIIERIDR